jgi:hypothetical protein
MYDRYIVPTPGKIYWDGLVSAGGIDLIAQAKMTKAMFEKQKRAPSKTELKIYPDRSHWTCIQPSWEEVADFALDWAVKNARAPSVRPVRAA